MIKKLFTMTVTFSLFLSGSVFSEIELVGSDFILPNFSSTKPINIRGAGYPFSRSSTPVYAETEEGVIFKSTDSGESWKEFIEENMGHLYAGTYVNGLHKISPLSIKYICELPENYYALNHEKSFVLNCYKKEINDPKISEELTEIADIPWSSKSRGYGFIRIDDDLEQTVYLQRERPLLEAYELNEPEHNNNYYYLAIAVGVVILVIDSAIIWHFMCKRNNIMPNIHNNNNNNNVVQANNVRRAPQPQRTMEGGV